MLAAVFWALGQAHPQEAALGVEQADDRLSWQQSTPDATQHAETSTHSCSKVLPFLAEYFQFFMTIVHLLVHTRVSLSPMCFTKADWNNEKATWAPVHVAF